MSWCTKCHYGSEYWNPSKIITHCPQCGVPIELTNKNPYIEAINARLKNKGKAKVAKDENVGADKNPTKEDISFVFEKKNLQVVGAKPKPE